MIATKIFNLQKQQYLDETDLKDGELFCDKCKGTGAIEYNSFSVADEMCPKCFGSGIVDWIEQVVGKKPIQHCSSSTSGYGVAYSGTSGVGYGAVNSGISGVGNVIQSKVTNI